MNKKRIISALLLAALFMGCFSAPVSVNPTTIVCKADTAKLGAPKIISTDTYTNSVKLTWSEVSGASGYKIYLYNSAKKKYVLKKTVTDTSARISRLKRGVKYKFKICSYVFNGIDNVEQKSAIIRAKTKSKSPSKVTLKATDFTVTSASGKSRNLSDFAGRPIVVNMWATWCYPCTSELPTFNKLAKEYKGDVTFLMINDEASSERKNVEKFIKENNYTFPLYFDYSGSASRAYSTGYIPLTVVINSKGKLIYHKSGTLTEEKLRSLIEEAF